MIRVLVLLVSILLLSSCTYLKNTSYFKSRNREYLAARSIPPLKVPPDLSSDTFQNEYPIAYRIDPEGAKDVSLVPPGL